MIDSSRAIKELGLTPFGAKGWYFNVDMECPECGKPGKFGIRFSSSGGAVHCFKCDFSESIYKYLRSSGRGNLISGEREMSINVTLTTLGVEKKMKEELPEVTLPRGFREIRNDTYLDSRNFTQYDEFRPGITDHYAERKLKDYIIFQIFQGGRRVGWVARSKKSKEWHKKNLEDYKAGKGLLCLRYMNSTGTDFSSILGGIDDVTDNTHTVFIVEGLFDKTNLSNMLGAENSEEVKVLFTFGNKISDDQINVLRQSNVEYVILMYDANTISQSKHCAVMLSRWFEVDVCSINDENIDPGNINEEYLYKVLSTKQNFLYFYNHKIQKISYDGKL